MLTKTDLPEMISWFPEIMERIAVGKFRCKFPASDPSGPGVAVVVDEHGNSMYAVDPLLWDPLAGILQSGSGLRGPDLVSHFRAQLRALMESL